MQRSRKNSTYNGGSVCLISELLKQPTSRNPAGCNCIKGRKDTRSELFLMPQLVRKLARGETKRIDASVALTV